MSGSGASTGGGSQAPGGGSAPPRSTTSVIDEPDQGGSAGEHLLVAVAVLVVAIVGVAVLSIMRDVPNPNDAQAQALATQLVEQMESAGLQTPDADVLASTYGTDGGAACTTADATFTQSQGPYNLQRTGEINQRPGLVDRRFAQYQRIMIQTYCPERLDGFNAFVKDLRLRRTLGALND